MRAARWRCRKRVNGIAATPPESISNSSSRAAKEFEEKLEMLPAGEVAEGILFAATRPPGSTW
jgi:hypothetical protein